MRGNVYVAVPSDSNVQTVKDLRGKRVAVQKGTSTHLAGVKILEKFGLSEKDVKIVNMDVVNAQLALITKDIDAAIGTTDYLRVRDQGAAKIVFATAGDPVTTSNGTLVASQSFLDKYPTTATRVLKVFVKAAQWLAETNPTQVFQLWTKSGTTFSSFREDWKGDDVKYRTSPLLDPYLAARYKAQIAEAKRFNLVKNTFSYEEWAEPKFLERALKELGLEGYWQPRGPRRQAESAGHETHCGSCRRHERQRPKAVELDKLVELASILISERHMTQSANAATSRSVSLELDSPELAATYDQTSLRQFNHGKVLIQALDPKSGERVLDIGCGTGRLGEHVANLVGPTGESHRHRSVAPAHRLCRAQASALQRTGRPRGRPVGVPGRQLRCRLLQQRLSLGLRQAQRLA